MSHELPLLVTHGPLLWKVMVVAGALSAIALFALGRRLLLRRAARREAARLADRVVPAERFAEGADVVCRGRLRGSGEAILALTAGSCTRGTGEPVIARWRESRLELDGSDGPIALQGPLEVRAGSRLTTSVTRRRTALEAQLATRALLDLDVAVDLDNVVAASVGRDDRVLVAGRLRSAAGTTGTDYRTAGGRWTLTGDHEQPLQVVFEGAPRMRLPRAIMLVAALVGSGATLAFLWLLGHFALGAIEDHSGRPLTAFGPHSVAALSPAHRPRALQELQAAIEAQPRSGRSIARLAAVLAMRDNCDRAITLLARHHQLDAAIPIIRDCDDADATFAGPIAYRDGRHGLASDRFAIVSTDVTMALVSHLAASPERALAHLADQRRDNRWTDTLCLSRWLEQRRAPTRERIDEMLAIEQDGCTALAADLLEDDPRIAFLRRLEPGQMSWLSGTEEQLLLLLWIEAGGAVADGLERFPYGMPRRTLGEELLVGQPRVPSALARQARERLEASADLDRAGRLLLIDLLLNEAAITTLRGHFDEADALFGRARTLLEEGRAGDPGARSVLEDRDRGWYDLVTAASIFRDDLDAARAAAPFAGYDARVDAVPTLLALFDGRRPADNLLPRAGYTPQRLRARLWDAILDRDGALLAAILDTDDPGSSFAELSYLFARHVATARDRLASWFELRADFNYLLASPGAALVTDARYRSLCRTLELDWCERSHHQRAERHYQTLMRRDLAVPLALLR